MSRTTRLTIATTAIAGALAMTACAGGSSEGVPPPKNTVCKGAPRAAGAEAAMSAHTALTYSSTSAEGGVRLSQPGGAPASHPRA
jgi:hypothetical protein